MSATGRAEAASQGDPVVRDISGSADKTAVRSGSGIVAPVTRDHRFQHYAPDRFSILRTASSAAERFEIRLQSLVHREMSQRLAIIPGQEMLTVGRDIRIEVVELAVIDLAWPQLVSLRDELTRAIAAAVPVAPDQAAERLAQLTAQIAVTEGHLSHLEWRAPPEPASPSLRELARLSDKIGMLIDRLEPGAIDRLQLPHAPARGRRRAAAWWGAALVAGAGLLAWSLSWDGRRAWPHWAGPGLQWSATAVSSQSVGSVPEPAVAPGAPPVLASSAQPPVAPTREAAAPPASDSPRAEPPAPQEPPASVAAAEPVAPAAPAKGTEAEVNPPAVSPVAEVGSPPEVKPAGGAAADGATGKSTAPGVAAPHVAIHVDADTWLRVRDGAGRNYIARVVKAGETWPVPPVQGLMLTTGNGASTSIVVDGVNGPALGAKGAVRTVSLP